MTRSWGDEPPTPRPWSPEAERAWQALRRAWQAAARWLRGK